MARAKGTLRSIGSSQLAYQGTNNDKHYGTFQGLKGDYYIASGYSLGNMIENYSMTWDVTDPGSLDGPITGGIDNNTFTVVAYPRDTRPGYLSTFAIIEDQVVRVYAQEPGVDLNSIRTWEPIL